MNEAKVVNIKCLSHIALNPLVLQIFLSVLGGSYGEQMMP